MRLCFFNCFKIIGVINLNEIGELNKCLQTFQGEFLSVTDEKRHASSLIYLFSITSK